VKGATQRNNKIKDATTKGRKNHNGHV